MDKLFPVSSDYGNKKCDGYADQLLQDVSDNITFYVSIYCYSSAVNNFKKPKKGSNRDFFERKYVDVDGRYRTINCSGNYMHVKTERIPDTDIANVNWFYSNNINKIDTSTRKRRRSRVMEQDSDNQIQEHIIFVRYSDVRDAVIRACIKAGKDEEDMLTKSYALSNAIRSVPVVREKIFKVLKKAVEIPVLEEWTDFLFDSSNSLSIFPCHAYYADLDNPRNLYAFSLRFIPRSIAIDISRALNQGHLSINGSSFVSSEFDKIKSLTDYLEHFSNQLISKAASRFSAVFDPNKEEFSEDERDYFDFTAYNSKLKMFNTQKNVMGAVSRALDKDNSAVIVGEMGCGKTLLSIGSTFLNAKNKTKDNFNNIVMCPGHLVKKWEREIKRLYPGSAVYIVSDFEDLYNLDRVIRNKNRHYPLFMVISKDTAKLSYTVRPNVIYDKHRHCFICPDCGRPLLNINSARSTTLDKDSYYKIRKTSRDSVRYDFFDAGLLYAFSEQTKDNSTCTIYKEKDNVKGKKLHVKPGELHIYEYLRSDYNKVSPWSCGCNLWSATTTKENTKWHKYPGFGYIHDDMIDMVKDDFERMKVDSEAFNAKEAAIITKAYKAILLAQEDKVVKNAPRRYSIARYIREKYKGCIDYFIADEVHMYSASKSAQANAFGDFVKVARKTIALTGTLLNGYADSIYYILFRMYPRSFRKLGYEYNSSSIFASEYGVEKHIFKRAGNNSDHYKLASKKTCPGISPKLFTEFLLDKAIFVSLSDMSSGLPKYTETPIGVYMDDNVDFAYKQAVQNVKNCLENTNDKSNKMSVAFAAAQKLNLYPDQPYDVIPVIDKDDFSKNLIEFPDVIKEEDRANYLSPKDKKTLEIVQSKINKGENVLIYVDYVNSTDCISRLEKMFKDNDIKSCTLTVSVSAKDREQWIDQKVREGCKVMICNPRLVETGLDLLSFTNIIFYQLGYNLFTMRQASRRSLRLNQPNDVNVYFLYFKDTAQEMVLSLMATKLQAAMAIEGKFSEEGLTAMGNNDSILTRIANSLIEDIEYKVEEGSFQTSLEAEEDDGSRFKMVYILDKPFEDTKQSLFNSSKKKPINMKNIRIAV